MQLECCHGPRIRWNWLKVKCIHRGGESPVARGPCVLSNNSTMQRMRPRGWRLPTSSHAACGRDFNRRDSQRSGRVRLKKRPNLRISRCSGLRLASSAPIQAGRSKVFGPRRNSESFWTSGLNSLPLPILCTSLRFIRERRSVTVTGWNWRRGGNRRFPAQCHSVLPGCGGCPEACPGWC